jgi:predicted Fe-Mo cluster-binding NifX family protein
LVKSVAVASEGSRESEDEVLSTHGKCDPFTIIDVEHGSVSDVKIQPNGSHRRSVGVGPLVSEMLHNLNVYVD